MHAMWVHGIDVRSEWVGDNLRQVRGGRWDSSVGDVGWTDVTGLPRGWGMTYAGKRSVTGGLGGSTTGPFDPADPFRFSQKGYWFHVAIPTPVILADRRSTLARVFLLWEGTDGVQPMALHVYDGIERVAALPFAPRARGLVGRGGHADLVAGVTRFDLPTPRSMLWSLGLSVGVSFLSDGEITFVSAGADFA